MPGLLPITRSFCVIPLLEMSNPEFSQWYSLGVWWAIACDEQPHRPYVDTYLIRNVSRDISYGELTDALLDHSGFYLGMLHGAHIEPASYTLARHGYFIQLTDKAFEQGMYDGHSAYTEPSDHSFMQLLHTHAHIPNGARSLA